MPPLTPLAAEAPEFRFPGRYPDLAALHTGDSTHLRPELTPDARSHWSSPDRTPGGALVLGGNGFVGAHVVARLSLRDDVTRVWTTVRGVGAEPLERFRKTLEQYQVTDVDLAKIVVLGGTPTEPRFGLSEQDHEQLVDEVAGVYSCASSTDYSVPYLDLRADWFLGLLRALQFCASGRPKHFTYVGSIGRLLYDEPDAFSRPDSWWYSGYAQLKWVNAQVLLALGAEGLPVTLCDTHYVLGSTSVGLDPGRHYSWWRAVEVARNVGVVWDGQGMNYIPVDVLADLLVTNALAESPLPRLVPRNAEPWDMSLFADILGLELAPWARFEQRARALAPAVARTLFSDSFEHLLDVVNPPPPLVPPGTDFSWNDNERLFRLYLSKIEFRPLRR